MAAANENESVPSIKGASIQPILNRLRGHIDSGKLSEAELDAVLEVDDQMLIGQRLAPTLWYPTALYDRLLGLLGSVEGAAGSDFFVRFGRETAAELLGSAAARIILTGARGFGERAGIALIKLSNVFLNYSRWEFRGESLEAFEVEVHDAGPMSENGRHVTLGFIQHLVEEFLGHPVDVVSERPRRDLVIFRSEAL